MGACVDCDRGDMPLYLDNDGVCIELSGKFGVLAHAYEDSWWPCPNPTPGKVTGAKLKILWYKLMKALPTPTAKEKERGA